MTGDFALLCRLHTAKHNLLSLQTSMPRYFSSCCWELRLNVKTVAWFISHSKEILSVNTPNCDGNEPTWHQLHQPHRMQSSFDVAGAVDENAIGHLNHVIYITIRDADYMIRDSRRCTIAFASTVQATSELRQRLVTYNHSPSKISKYKRYVNKYLNIFIFQYSWKYIFFIKTCFLDYWRVRATIFWSECPRKSKFCKQNNGNVGLDAAQSREPSSGRYRCWGVNAY